MPDERFEEHLRHPRGRGHAPAGGHRRRRRRRGVRRPRAHHAWPSRAIASPTPASTPPAAARRSPPASAAVELVARRARCSTPRASGRASDRRRARRAERSASSTPPTSPPTRCTRARRRPRAPTRRLARRRRAARSSRCPAASTRRRRAAQRARRRRGRSPSRSSCGAIPENDAERSCCSASAVRGARALAHGLGLPHLTLDLRDEFRAGVVEPVAGRARRRADAEPVRALQRPRPPRRDARPRRPRSAPRRWPPATTRASATTGCCAPAADPAKDQSYMLAGLAPRDARAAALPARRADQAARCASSPRAHGLPVARKPDSQDLCFLAGTGRAAFLARHGGLRERPGRHRRPRAGARSAATAARTTSRSASAAGSASAGRGEPLYVLATDARANTVTVGPRAALATDARALRDVRLHARAGEVDARQAALPRPPRRLHAATATAARCASPFEAPRRARRPCCCAATSSSDARRSLR